MPQQTARARVRFPEALLTIGRVVYIMRVTDVKIRRVERDGESRMRALVSVTFNDVFVIHDVRVIRGNNGLFVAMPSKRTRYGEFKDVAHPICPSFRALLEKEVLSVYSRHVDEEVNLRAV